jgi:hypothetical protein
MITKQKQTYAREKSGALQPGAKGVTFSVP